ncbi:ABC transporter permease subunit [Hahella sp. KA22]|nr:ABC transporter permease [Hahella sp. KA22]QAY58306.1 ABC transporter permease subunit [Hahella sp. KA22]
MSVLAIAALLFLDFASFQPNRILPGEGVALLDALSLRWGLPVFGGALAIALLSWRPNRHAYLAILLTATTLIAFLPVMAGVFGLERANEGLPHGRAALGSGFWLTGFLMALIMIEACHKLQAGIWLKLAGVTAVVAGIAIAYSYGALEKLSLAQEFHVRQRQFVTEMGAHFNLVFWSMLPSALMGMALAIWATRSEKARRGLFGVLSVMQTIPSLALFGLLIAPLSYLANEFGWLRAIGVQGIGFTPALIALIGYSLLPMTRNAYVALTGTPEPVLEAARGMGMSESQVFLQVRLPLAAPVILEGLRIMTVQTIGLTAVAALIGAGGMGTFIFQGLGQAAMDLVLLGAIPTILFALAADALFAFLTATTRGAP